MINERRQRYLNNMMNKRHCAGCESDYYNYDGNGGEDGCWDRKSATIILRKQVPMSQIPPWKQKAKKFPSCYHMKQFVFVGEDVTC